MPPLNAKDIVVYLVHTFELSDVNWALQMRLAKNLLKKYKYGEIKYAIDYYKTRGDSVRSLGFLSYKFNMKDPVSLYHAESNVMEGDNSADRNWARIRQNSQTHDRTVYPINLFEESDEND